MRLIVALLVTAALYGQPSQLPPSSGGSGVSVCSTTPPTTGTSGQVCVTGTSQYLCHTTGACSISGDWTLIGPTVVPTTRTWNYSFQGADYGGVPVFAGNIPATSAPTAKLNSTSDLSVLDFPTAQSTYTWYGSWRMPPAYPASGAISYVISSMCDPVNCDSTHAANVYISLACSGTTARPDATSYTELTAPIVITNSASGYQTVTTGTITPGSGTPALPACATANRATIKLRVDTSANSLTGSFQLVAVGFYVQGQL